MIRSNETGVYNATGPDYMLTLSAMLEACRQETSEEVHFVHVAEDWLEEKEVHAWSDIPVWIPDVPEMHGFARINCRKAIAHGLAFRSIRRTVADTLHWAGTRPEEYDLHAGLKPEREHALLAEWAARA